MQKTFPDLDYLHSEDGIVQKWHLLLIVFLSGFSFTDTDDSQDSRGREWTILYTIWNTLYHFHPLTNLETFIYNFACEMTITYF